MIREVDNIKKPFSPPREVHVQVTHSMPPQKIEIFKSLEDWAEENILVHLKPVEKCWQPQDFLPEPESEGFLESVEELRKRAKEIPDEYFVCLVGDMITEEALPTYQTMLNTLDGVRDETGASPTSWAIWTRAWTAEENRHGDLLNKYLYLSGRVDMRQIEKTIQYLIGSGMVRSSMNTNCFFFWNGNEHENLYSVFLLFHLCLTVVQFFSPISSVFGSNFYLTLQEKKTRNFLPTSLLMIDTIYPRCMINVIFINSTFSHAQF